MKPKKSGYFIIGEGRGGLVHDDYLRIVRNGFGDFDHLPFGHTQVLHFGDGRDSIRPFESAVHPLAGVRLSVVEPAKQIGGSFPDPGRCSAQRSAQEPFSIS